MPLTDAEWGALTLGLTALVYRLLSPLVAWCAVRLGAGRYPRHALNGAYPEAGVPLGRGLAVGTVLAVLTAVDAVFGTMPDGWLALVPTGALALMLWKHLTQDYDLGQDLRWQRRDRLAVLIVGTAALVFPALGLAAIVLVCGRLGGWTHHANVDIRLIKATYCFALANSLLTALVGPSAAASTTGLALVLGTVYLSHYVVAAWAKAKLGRRPWSWALTNRTDLLVATAYAWGWARFLPAGTAARIVRALRPVVVWLNLGTMAVELAGLVAFADLGCFLAGIGGALLFNCVVALTSGLLFWENIATGLLLAGAMAADAGAGRVAFGGWTWLGAVAVLMLVVAGLLWRPNVLGWWDTPLSAKVWWRAHTADGRVFGLYNDFFGPHDREYARVVGNALVPEPMITFPLGGVEDVAIRDVLLREPLRPADLGHAKHRYGVVHRDEDRVARHAAYLRTMMAALNAGLPKNPLPRGLHWLRAPSGHLYRWGDAPRYRRADGPVAQVSVWFREELYVGASGVWERLSETPVLTVEVAARGRCKRWPSRQ